MRSRVLILLFALIGIASMIYLYSSQPRVYIADQVIKVEVADEPYEREIGLSYRDYLPDDRGMIFVFDSPSIYSFWMKDMNFDIDIIWISQNFEIIDITNDATPESYPSSFTSIEPAKYVLEVNSNFVEQSGVSIGQDVKLEL